MFCLDLWKISAFSTLCIVTRNIVDIPGLDSFSLSPRLPSVRSRAPRILWPAAEKFYYGLIQNINKFVVSQQNNNREILNEISL